MSDDRIDVGELARQKGKHADKKREDTLMRDYDDMVRKVTNKYIETLNIDAVPDWVVTAASRGEHTIVAYNVRFNIEIQHHGTRYTPFCAFCGHDGISEIETRRGHSQDMPCKPGHHQDTDYFEIPDRAPAYNVLPDVLKIVHARIVKIVNERVAHVYVRTRYTSNRAFKIELLWGNAYPQFTRRSNKIKHVSSRTAQTINGTVFCV